MKQIFISTTDSIDGVHILEYKGIVTTNIVAGTSFLSDFAASFTDFFGGRSGTYKKQMSTIYDEAIEELSLKAIRKGANAILGFKIDFDSISAKNMSMLMISVTGTAVLVQESADYQQSDNSREIISSISVKNEINKRKIIDKLNTKNFLYEDDWELVLQYPSDEYAEALCLSAYDYSNSNDITVSINKYISHLGEYLSMIERKTAINAIYSVIGRNAHDHASCIIKIIKERNLFDAKSVQDIILSGNLATACDILDAGQDSYSMDDLKDMEYIITLFENLPNKGKISFVKSGVLSKEKEKYICPDGHSNDKELVFCATCDKNIKGLTPSQLKQIESFRIKVDSLRFLFERKTEA